MLENIPQLAPATEELGRLKERLDKILSPLGRRLLDRFLPDSDDELLPATLVIFCGQCRGGSELLAAQLIALTHYGTALHHLPEIAQTGKAELLVLAGDYCYAHLFQLLSTGGVIFLLERMARLIGTINEGYLLLEKGEDKESGLTKRFGSLFGEGMAIGALLSGAGAAEEEALRTFGAGFGIAYGARRLTLDGKWADERFRDGLKALALLPWGHRLAEVTRRLLSMPHPVAGTI